MIEWVPKTASPVRERCPLGSSLRAQLRVGRLVVSVLNWVSMNAMGRTIQGLAHFLYDSLVKQIVDFGSFHARLFGTQPQCSAEIEFDNPMSMYYMLRQNDTSSA
jgi:hypothetical protein